jgi:hypothetical protein
MRPTYRGEASLFPPAAKPGHALRALLTTDKCYSVAVRASLLVQ